MCKLVEPSQRWGRLSLSLCEDWQNPEPLNEGNVLLVTKQQGDVSDREAEAKEKNGHTRLFTVFSPI